MADAIPALEQLFDDWSRGDFKRGADLLHPDVVFITFTTEADDLVYHGVDGLVSWLKDFFASWEGFGIAAERFIPSGDTVLVEGRQWARGRRSGARVEMPVFSVWRFRDGRAYEVHWLRDGARARELAGLHER